MRAKEGNDGSGLFSPGEAVGDYVIEQRLGAGAFGEVFLAREQSPRRLVALKFLRPQFAADTALARRFTREVDAMAAVAHPNVVPIHRHGHERGLPYFSMRYVSGGSLDAFLAAEDRSLRDVLELLAGVAEGLDHCHACGIVHRDLKPANVLVDADGGRGLLADFGIAGADELSTLTRGGGQPGTPAYMAPETLLGGRATAASDLWALGAVTYRAATGTLPRGLHGAADAEVVPPSRRNGSLGPQVDRVILRALSFDPARRQPDARTFVTELRAALERPTHRRRRPRRAPGRPPVPGRSFQGVPRGLVTRRIWSVAGAAIVLAPAVVYGVASVTDRENPNAIVTDCHPSYADVCLKPDAGDYDCRDGRGDGPNFVDGRVRVVGRDVFGLDGDGDGLAC